MFRLHELLRRFEEEVVTREQWRRDGRGDMVGYQEDRLREVRRQIEQDMLSAFHRAARP